MIARRWLARLLAAGALEGEIVREGSCSGPFPIQAGKRDLAEDRPNVEAFITQHTLWQALTGRPPPPRLASRPIGRAVLDSRDVEPGALFIAVSGSRTDGHEYIGQAVAAGAGAVICEERGLAFLADTDALIVDCSEHGSTRNGAGRSPAAARQAGCIAYVVPDSNAALQAAGSFQRLHRTRPELRVTGVTGSVGKTSTKELAASVLSQRFCTHRSTGNLNSEQGLPLALLGLHTGHERAVLEMGMYDLGEIRLLCDLARPHIGLVTNVGPSHLERLGTIDRIAQAKAELIEALPGASCGGAAILNWDDVRVRAMATRTEARPFFYGLSAEADLWADEVESLGMEGIRFRLHHRQEDGDVHRERVRLPLLGKHSVQTALAAAAVGIVNGLTWTEIVAGLQNAPGQLRLVVTAGINGAMVIDDTYNASPGSTVAALNLLDDLGKDAGAAGRRIAVLGDMRELGSFTTEGHKQVGIHAASVTDLLVTVGELGRIIADEARRAGLPAPAIHAAGNFETAVQIVKKVTRPGDLLLVKGSRAVGMDRIVSELIPPRRARTNTTAQPAAQGRECVSRQEERSRTAASLATERATVAAKESGDEEANG